MKIKSFIILGAAAMSLWSCGGEEKAERVAADTEAAQMMGREEARKFLNRPWKDTLELQRQLLESRAKKSHYEMKNEKENAAAFDSAFVSTLRTVRPELARELENHPTK